MAPTLAHELEAKKTDGKIELPANEPAPEVSALNDAFESAERADKTNVVFYSKVVGDVFDDFSGVVYPPLLNPVKQMDMSIEELIANVDFVLSTADRHDTFKGVYIYSLQVIEPLSISKSIDSNFLRKVIPPPFQLDAMRGYLYHGLLYQLEILLLSAILREILTNATLVEIKIRRGVGQVSEERKLIRLVHSTETTHSSP